jgi:hypothetical protein
MDGRHLGSVPIGQEQGQAIGGEDGTNLARPPGDDGIRLAIHGQFPRLGHSTAMHLAQPDGLGGEAEPLAK